MNDQAPDDTMEQIFEPTKIEILKRLQNGPMTAADLANELSLTDPDIVEEMQELLESGVVKENPGVPDSTFELTPKAQMAEMFDEALSPRVSDDLDGEAPEVREEEEEKETEESL